MEALRQQGCGGGGWTGAMDLQKIQLKLQLRAPHQHRAKTSTSDFLKITSSDTEGSRKRWTKYKKHISTNKEKMPPELVSSNAERSQIINLTDYSLSTEEEGMLQKGLTFSFSPMARLDRFIMIKDLYFYCRNLTLKIIYMKTTPLEGIADSDRQCSRIYWSYYTKTRVLKSQLSPSSNGDQGLCPH